MTRRPNNRQLVERFPKRQAGEEILTRLPFWISTSNYYVLAAAVSIATFFLVWGVLSGHKEEIPWITAGIASSLILIGTVALRSFFLRRSQRRFLLDRKQIDRRLGNIRKTAQNNQNLSKLTLEKNATILEAIEKKSEAARVLKKLPEGHLEVFEMCDEYLRKNDIELKNIGAGSPRLSVLRKSKQTVEKFHKYHLLAWASLESRLLIQDAKIRVAMTKKLENSQRALSVLDSAVQFYPNEALLTESITAVKDFIVTIKVNHWTEQAERAAFKKNYKRAVNYYRDALYSLARENERTPERDLIAKKINYEIEKLTEEITRKK